ncbi:helix-turn-helix domain-containing protein [Rahnella bonaserana]|uniref:winged helix-turn-helix domain-containing protein n=1 Tax=Rahnella bonaserana TaxID=2816248 RepID=UPI0024C3C9AB|nr:helix-turn-helix domain-containing protein [Rahnella bonaserana]WHZ41075.1 helix-turn-helix domain-containing protein [Rahnella bonaserana]
MVRRILLLLIEQQGVVVQRETFFKKVWDDYGLNASNNNLNHCISKLRKVVSTLGFETAILLSSSFSNESEFSSGLNTI